MCVCVCVCVCCVCVSAHTLSPTQPTNLPRIENFLASMRSSARFCTEWEFDRDFSKHVSTTLRHINVNYDVTCREHYSMNIPLIYWSFVTKTLLDDKPDSESFLVISSVMHCNAWITELNCITGALHMKCTKTADFKPEMSIAVGTFKKAHWRLL